MNVHTVNERIQTLLDADDAPLYKGQLHGLVQQVFDNRETYLEAARAFGTPQYLVEESRLCDQVQRFNNAFQRPGRIVRTHYAFKANPSLCIVQALQRAGLSADASSGLELELALRCGFDRIVLSGPAKTDDELRLALHNADRVTVHLDSFRELDRLEALAAEMKTHIRAGVRLNTQGHGLWTKFGIPLNRLPDFVQHAQTLQHVQLGGIQFHLSWNRNANGYKETLAALRPFLEANSPAGGWTFIDIGGGYYPEDDEAAYPWLTPKGRLQSLLGEIPAEGPPPDWDMEYLLHPVMPIETMAQEVLDAFDACTTKLGNIELWLEPGRYMVNQTVQLMLSVIDVKGDELAITDGGTNLFGWERLESEHCPLINLTHPSDTQRPFRVYGSLCTPHDLWGYTCYGSTLLPGDVLLLPAQGSYVQTLAQRFIKPICQTVFLSTSGETHVAEPAETFLDRY
ncbi:MAG: alanine racemase, partial [bacterium]|nr:alanine racemase [bacterium]